MHAAATALSRSATYAELTGDYYTAADRADELAGIALDRAEAAFDDEALAQMVRNMLSNELMRAIKIGNHAEVGLLICAEHEAWLHAEIEQQEEVLGDDRDREQQLRGAL